MTRRVLVTGAAGFLGRHTLGPLRARGFEVHAVTSRPVPTDPTGVAWHRADLLAAGECGRLVSGVRPTHLLHLAWYTAHGAYWASPENVRWVEASPAPTREFAGCGGRRLVFAGTCAEYDWRYGFCSEGVTPLTPATLYGVSKAAAFGVAEAFARAAGVSAAAGRVFLPFGPGEPAARLIPSAVRSVLSGGPVRVSDGNMVRDFLYVGDCGDAFAALLASPVEGGVNIGSGRPRAVADLIRAVTALVPGGDRVAVEYGAIPARPGDPPVLVADVRRLTGEVGWRPPTGFDVGLTETVRYWRAADPLTAEGGG